MRKIALRFFMISLALSATGIVFNGCTKEDPEYPVKIYVKYFNSEQPVPGATVTIYKHIYDTTTMHIPTPDVVLTTGSTGIVDQVYKLPAIYDVEATWGDTSSMIFTGKAIARLKENETVPVVIYIK